MSAFILLTIAIISEVIGSSLLKITNGFKRILPTLGVVLGYGVAYAIWSGVGTALTALIGIIIFKEGLNTKKTIGLLCIIGGVIVLNLN